jgi:hypothetical protein
MDASPTELLSLRGRRIVLGVSGGIAAYKAVEVCRRLVDAGRPRHAVLTDDAQRFIGALTFSALASEPGGTSLFPSSSSEGAHGADPAHAARPARRPDRRGARDREDCWASTRTASPTTS